LHRQKTQHSQNERGSLVEQISRNEKQAASFLNGVSASMEMRFNKTNALLLKRLHQLCIL
jgi:hypothetical protein